MVRMVSQVFGMLLDQLFLQVLCPPHLGPFVFQDRLLNCFAAQVLSTTLQLYRDQA